MFDRPLVPLLLSFAGGIIVAHSLLPPSATADLFLFFAISLSLFAACILPTRLTCFALSLSFFLTGILLSRPAAESSLLALSDTHEKLTLQGVVLESPTILPGEMARVRVHVSGVIDGGHIQGISEDIRLTIYGHTPFLEAGERIRFPARVRPFKNFENPGRYDYVSAMKSKGLSCTAYVSDGRRVVPMGRGDLPFHLNVIEALRKPLRHLLEQQLNPRNGALYKALILGERQWITPDIRDLFNRTGLGHILAVSGLHIGLVALISFLFFKTVMLRAHGLTLRVDVRKMTALLTCIPVIGYTLLAGFQISSQRAMIMGLAFLGSFVLGREKEVWSTLALAGLIILF
ncbi:MAG: ComEC family competence protein [Deltaproteobacteria bacterium]|nr:ComEC family competence protein [Deltaproteobacteria bacterium]